MFTLKDLTAEINAMVLDNLNAEIAVHPNFVTTQILEKRKDIKGKDTDFYQCVAYAQVRHEVGNCIRRLKITPESAVIPDPQLILPGFVRLQKAYLVDNDGIQMAIPITKMSRKQRFEKINELRVMGDGCYQHADELERYDREHPAHDQDSLAA